MATVTESRPISKPITSLDPWTDRPGYAVPVTDLVFGARLRHVTQPGVWKIVRGAERRDSTSRYHVRVRQQAGDGTLYGRVESWRVDEVAELVTDEPKAEPAEADLNVGISHIEPPAPATDEPKPLDVAMVISIDQVHYAVAPLAPAPGASKAYRFQKIGGDEAQHDLDQSATVASCTCGDFVWRHEGRDDEGCKHIKGCRLMGLLDWPAEQFNSAAKLVPAPCCESCTAEELARDAFEDIAESEAGTSLDAEDESWRYGPQDDGGGGWDAYDDSRWTISETIDDAAPARSLEEQVLDHARSLRAEGSPLGDLLAERAEHLAAEIRYLSASTVEQYRDRREAALDAARDAAEARAASRCC